MKKDLKHGQILGLDIGSVAVAIAGVTPCKAVLWIRFSWGSHPRRPLFFAVVGS